MKKFILAKKLKMTRIFQEDGKVVPVTVLEAGPCFVVQVRDKNKDGYRAVQVGFGQKKLKNITKPEKGHLEKNLSKELKSAFAYLREFRVDGEDVSFKPGDEIKVDIFEPGEKVKVTSNSKGRGFQGVVKRWGFAGGPKSHGQKDRLRAPGSIGATTPSRVIKGKKMPGRMGGKTVTVKNLEIVKIDKENNLLAVKGAVPGARGILVKIETVA